ncbi:MAG TPA: aminodeoxychorismate synthase component I, partial [Azonexus sp.]|nr:aminodeoxychorismate synthase component I [Azonexus sp.]
PAAWRFEDPVDCLTVSDDVSLAATLKAVEGDGLWSVAALDFELGYLLEPAAAPPGWSPSAGRPLARLWRFRRRFAMTAEAAGTWLAEQGAGQPAGIGGLHAGIDENRHAAAVDRIRDYISAGDCYQVNFTFPLTFQWFGHPLALYARLRARQPVSYGGFLGDAAGGIVSLSPELFLEREGTRLVTRPMKGTLARGQPAERLRASAKDRAENLMIVDLLRNDLGRVAASGSVKVERLFEIEDYPTLWQMVSEVSANAPGIGLAAILRALFPCGSVTGAPKIRAMQIIAELEQAPRGLYTGAFGWIAPDGDFRLNVAIRTLELAADRTGRLGIGSGIVADSEPAAEWQECMLKADFLRDCDPGLQLIETLRRENGQYPLLAGHLSRLRRSADWLGFALDEDALRGCLDAQPANGIWRVRVMLAKNGDLAAQCFPLADEPGGIRYARLAATLIDSGDPLRGHKTSERGVYDDALRSLPADSTVFDLVFLNERGEVAEGARSNVFVERAGQLLTPPLESGALPGVLRAALLASGEACEAVLWPEDLQHGFWLLGNALRGLIPVCLESPTP